MLWETLVCENGTHNFAHWRIGGFSSHDVHLVLNGFGGEKPRSCDAG